MGHGTDPDPTSDDCLCCFDVDKTPGQVYIAFAGIERCDKPFNGRPNPLNDIVIATQDELFPCYFEWEHNLWRVVWDPCPIGFAVLTQKWNGDGMFGEGLRPQCTTLFSNQLDCIGPTIYGHNGYAGVMWNTGPTDHSIGSLLDSINMEPHTETKFEFWPASEERVCVRFARKSDATNILILAEPTEL